MWSALRSATHAVIRIGLKAPEAHGLPATAVTSEHKKRSIIPVVAYELHRVPIVGCLRHGQKLVEVLHHQVAGGLKLGDQAGRLLGELPGPACDVSVEGQLAEHPAEYGRVGVRPPVLAPFCRRVVAAISAC